MDEQRKHAMLFAATLLSGRKLLDWRELGELLPRVTQILIIGWQGKEAHFLKLLREKLPTGGITQITHLLVVEGPT